MARIKDENGLTRQQELFCQYVVDAYGNNDKAILITAYRMAYNCKSDTNKSWHYSEASKLNNDPKIALRIQQIKAERKKREEEIETEKEKVRFQLVRRNLQILDKDPLDLMKEDEETRGYRMKKLNEIPKRDRKILRRLVVEGRLVYDYDKKWAEKTVIDVLGLSRTVTDTTVNFNNDNISFGFGKKNE